FGMHEGAIVAARIHFDVPVASGLGWTLAGTEDVVDFDSDNPESLQLNSSPIARSLLEKHRFCVLGRSVNDRFVGEVVVMASKDGSQLRILRDVRRREHLQVLAIDSDHLNETIVSTLTQPIARARIENPVGSIAFHCSSLFRYHREIGLEIETLLE